MRVAVVCEGSTDYSVLHRLVRALVPSSDLVILPAHPNFDALRAKVSNAIAAGWTGVRTYLQNPDSALVASATDVLVVQIDADVRLLASIKSKLRPPNPGDDALDPFCDHVKTWFDAGVPPSTLIVIPREATEAWLLAVHTHVKEPEADPKPVDTLLTKGVITASSSDAAKKAERYAALIEPLAAVVLDKKKLARLNLPELARFAGKLQSLARRAKKARVHP
jgi:hypothetical protein